MYSEPIVFAVKHKNEKIRSHSRSGGIFTAISDYVLDEGGLVYGCVLNEDFHAQHIRVDNREERDLMRGSKYIQSHLGDTFISVRNDLNDGRLVMFSGTPCQVAGLKNFLRKDYDNLICVDIVCHGVPSKAVWDRYLEWLSKKENTKVMNVNFRNKTDYGWAAHVETIKMENGSKINSEIFKNLFYGHEILRPSCYSCRWKNTKRVGDITIGDFWGIDEACPGFNDDKGVSLVLINSETGNKVFELVKNELIIQPAKIELALQPPLRTQFPKPEDRDRFWNDFENRSFTYIAKKYANFGTVNEIKNFLRKVKGKLHL